MFDYLFLKFESEKSTSPYKTELNFKSFKNLKNNKNEFSHQITQKSQK